MPLSVAKPTAQPKLTVRNSNSGDGLGYNTYNPQQTAPSTVLQNPATAQVYHPTYNPQRTTYNPQPVATAAQVAAAAEVVRQAQAVELARQETVRKAARKTEVQGQINNRASTIASGINLKVSNSRGWNGKLSFGKVKPMKIEVPQYETDEYNKAYKEAYDQAMSEAGSKKEAGKKRPFWQKIGDKLSFGQDRREQSARDYAQKKADEVATKNISSYSTKLEDFTNKQASKKAAIEAAKFTSQAEFDRAVADYSQWENSNISALERERAATTAQLDAFGTASSAKLSSTPAKAVGWGASALNKVENNPLWKYTLGSGSKNAPSIVTVPSRVVSWLGNLNTKDRSIYKTGGEVANRAKSGENAWQSGYNQRNFNIRPYVDKPFDRAAAEKEFGKQAKKDADFYTKYPAKKGSKNWKEEQQPGSSKLGNYEDELKRYWNAKNAEKRFGNSAKEFVVDPLILLGAAKSGAKALGWGDKLAEAGRATKATAWAFKTADKVAEAKAALGETKVIKWLGSEHKSAGQKLADAIGEANKAQTATGKLLPRLNALNKKLTGNSKLDVSVFDDLKNLTDSEAKVIQRMVDGKITGRDRAFLVGRNNQPVRDKLEGIAKRWQDLTEQMKLADKVKTTSYGAGKKTYSPRTSWIKGKEGGLDNYNFRLFRKKGIQSKENFYSGAVDRYFKSGLDESFAKSATTKRARQLTERDALLKQYDDVVNPARDAVEKAYAKTKTPWARAQKVISAPTKIWKQSVLKYRPAWTVNNVLYNTQAGVLAGGTGSLAEQAKMLNPRYWRKAMDESRGVFGGNLTNEIGKSGKLNRFYSGVEDWSRVASGRAAMKSGYSAEQAAKRVDKYLFNYKTANWERPIKAAVPFWAFQKNLAKAAVTMPFDRPVAAAGYHRIDQYQQDQYSKEFDSMVPQLKKLGYKDDEIAKFKLDNEKYYHGKLKVGKKWFNTPFNAFSEKGLSTAGINPWLAAAGENATATDHFGKPLKGKDASLTSRVASKFPQIDLAQQAYKSLDIQRGKSKPVRGWISKPGSEGYGMTKERQGFDTSKPNYDRSMDPRAKLGQNALAFVGVPRSTEFDKEKFVKGKTLQKATSEYFALDTKDMKYPDAEAKRQEVFKKFGITADDFYKGILAKYDTDATKKLKGEKEAASKANKSLFDEYAKQPKGTRNLWATNKLRELVGSGYFKDNPFLKSFDWIKPDTVAKADKQQLVKDAVASGDWSKYRTKYGTTTSQKSKDYRVAKSTGDWSKYRTKYATANKQSPFQSNGKYFKTAESMQKNKDGLFWRQYATASKADRKKLLAESPQYNARADWTAEMWNTWKAEQKKKTVAKFRGWNGDTRIDQLMAQNKTKASVFLSSKSVKRGTRKLKWA